MNDRAELDELRGRTRPGAIGERYDRRPADGPPPAGNLGIVNKFLKVTALKKIDGDPWTGFEAAGQAFIAWIEGSPCDSGGGEIRTGRTLKAKATAAPTTAAAGYESIAVDDVVGYLVGDGSEPIPGTEPTEYFAGCLVANAGSDGATMTARVVD